MSARAVSFSYTVEMEERRCPVCGIAYAVDRYVMEEKVRNKGEFYCPNGHCRVFRESEAERLKKQLAATEAKITDANARAWKAEEAKTKAERRMKKLEKRIVNGVCPCCNRSFSNSALAKHIKTKHPEFAAAENIAPEPAA